jgi:hypothetical protein
MDATSRVSSIKIINLAFIEHLIINLIILHE